MIYFIYGDSNKIFKKTNDLIDSILSKNTEATLIKIDSDNFDNFSLDEVIGGQSLFTGKQIIYLKKLFENKQYSEILLKKIKEISESPNIFIITEEKLNKPILNKIEKFSEKVQNFESKKVAVKRDNNIFDLANALGDKDPKKIWLLYQEKIKSVRPEEIHGILWWQVKSILSAMKSSSPSDSGLKPFVFQKANTYSKKYKEEEIEKIADDLVNMVHLSRRDGISLDLALERFILGI
jgi:hypothetical protein